MKFFIDEDLPESLLDTFQNFGYEAVHVRGVELRGKKDKEIASYAQKEGLVIVTGDYDFSDVRNYPPSSFAGIVVIQLPRDATASVIRKQFNWLLNEIKDIQRITQKLVILEPGRIRIRNG